MAQDTFGQLWNRVLLYAPGTPVPIAQEAVRHAYSSALRYHNWSDLWGVGERVVATAFSTGTASVTHDGTAVAFQSSVGAASCVTQQIHFGNTQPYYTITAIGTNTATLDKAYEAPTTTSTSYEIGEFYVEFPSDLLVLEAVRDLDRNWVLHPRQQSANYLDRIDARRHHTGSPYLIVAAPPRVESGVSYPRFEFYPRLPDGTHIAYRYTKDSKLTSNSDRIIPTLDADAILFGALAEVCLWPGTAERPNPWFNMDLHKKYNDMYEEHIHLSELQDLEKAQTMISYDEVASGIPADAAWRQSHGIPL